MTKQRQKVLIVHTRELCYFSASFFLDRIQESLEEQDIEVIRLDLSGEDADIDRLEQFADREFLAVLDINSRLPYLKGDDGGFWLDTLKAPFFNYILDHPLYHHPGLSFPLQQYHVIGIDRRHCRYMGLQYAHIRSASYLPLAGTRAVSEIPFAKRPIELLFGGTYLDEERMETCRQAVASRLGQPFSKLMDDLRDAWDPYEETLEDTAERYIGDRGMQPQDFGADSFAALLNLLYPLDRDRRNAVRKELLLALAREGMPLTVMGEGWERTELAAYPHVELLPPRSYAKALEVIARTKRLLDIDPFFLDGLHDRVSCGLANGCACISNMAEDALETGADGRELIVFHGADKEMLLEKTESMKEEELSRIAAQGRAYYEKDLTWEAFGQALARIFFHNPKGGYPTVTG